MVLFYPFSPYLSPVVGIGLRRLDSRLVAAITAAYEDSEDVAVFFGPPEQYAALRAASAIGPEPSGRRTGAVLTD